MIIKNVKIENFGAVDSFELSLNPQVNLVSASNADQIATALDILLCKTEVLVQKNWIKKSTRLYATVQIQKEIFFVKALPQEKQPFQISAKDINGVEVTNQYKYVLKHCVEQDEIERLNKNSKFLPLRLKWYKNPDLYNFGNLVQKTKGLARTKFFKLYLKNFMQEKSQNNIQQDLYQYYLTLVDFWDGIESIRNIHYEAKPLIIEDFKQFNCQNDAEKMLKHVKKINRQIILI